MADSLTSSSTSLNESDAQGTNPLDDFQTFNNLFTLAGCTRSQIQGNIDKEGIDNIICRSQSIGKDAGVSTAFGKFDYFIDDVTLVTVPRPSKETANSFATKLTFKVHEPYSMGLFMLALRTAAAQSGYDLNFKEAPFIFMIEWVGYIDNKPGSPGDNLTRIIPIKIIDVKFKVGMTGSSYEVTAIPYNEFAFREQAVNNVTDIQISGTTVGEMLVDGPKSLYHQLQMRYNHEVNELKHISDMDQVLIQFPKDYMQYGGIENDVSTAKIYEDLNNAGVQPFSELPDIFIENSQIYKTAPFKLEDDRSWHFTQEISIPDIITEVIIRSHYITDQIVNGQLTTDDNGMVNWFRIEPRVIDQGNNLQMGRQKRLIVYRVLPYKVHIHRFLPPGQQPKVGYDNLKNTVARIYNYIYTGQNTEILNLELQFDMAFFTPVPSDAGTNVGQSNPGQKGITAGGTPPENVFPTIVGPYDFGLNVPRTLPDSLGGGSPAGIMYQFGSSLTVPSAQMPSTAQSNSQGSGDNGKSAEMRATSVGTAQRQFFYKAPGGGGTDDDKTSQVRTMQILLTNPSDMVNLNMEIMGDPYYIPSSGMGSQSVEATGNNELKDGSMNYQESEVMVIVNFRTPTDFDPKTGLYTFEEGIDMWSGLYQLTEVESRFFQNKFTQTVKGFRLRAQLGGENAESIFLKEGQGKETNFGKNSSGDSYGAGLLNPDTGGTGSSEPSLSGGGGGGGGGAGGQSSPALQTFPQNGPSQPFTGAPGAGIPQTNPGFGGLPLNTGQ